MGRHSTRTCRDFHRIDLPVKFSQFAHCGWQSTHCTEQSSQRLPDQAMDRVVYVLIFLGKMPLSGVLPYIVMGPSACVVVVVVVVVRNKVSQSYISRTV